MEGTALLVDGDQVGPDVVLRILTPLERSKRLRQRICVRNWRSTKDQQTWNQFSLKHSFDCRQSNPKTAGKNASDIELAVIGMELLSQGVKDFVIVTGDSDFQPLVAALIRGGAKVEWIDPSLKRTPAAPVKVTKKPPTKPEPNSLDGTTKQMRQRYLKGVRRVIAQILKDGNHEKGWVPVSVVGTQLRAADIKREDSGYPLRWPMHQVLESEGFKLKRQASGQFLVSIS